MKHALLAGDIVHMARVLEQSWHAKKETASGVSTDRIELLHQEAIKAGALAGKISGAGGGGFVMFLVPAELRLKVITALNAAGGQAEGVHLTKNGAESWTYPSKNS